MTPAPLKFKDMNIKALRSIRIGRAYSGNSFKLSKGEKGTLHDDNKAVPEWNRTTCNDCGENCVFLSDRKVPLPMHRHIGCPKG